MSRINLGRLNTGKIGGRIRIRIMRPWRGYAVGTVIDPPGGMAQILLQAKDQMGNKVAEVVDEPVIDPVPESIDDGEVEEKRRPGRPRKGETK